MPLGLVYLLGYSHITIKYLIIEQEIKCRITLGWKAFGRASEVFKNKDIPILLKRL